MTGVNNFILNNLMFETWLLYFSIGGLLTWNFF